jgi:ribosomal subunit interface protein
MDILIQATGVTLAENLKATIEDKIAHLEQYAPRALRARVRVRKVSAHASDRQYCVRILCEIPGNDLSAEENGADVLTAVEAAAAKIERRLSKRKTERLAKRGRGPRAKEKS